MAGTPKTRKILTLQERISVLKELDSGKSCRQVADELGVGKTQIQSIRKRKREIQEDFENNAPSDRKRRCLFSPYDDINELVWKWFQAAVQRNGIISGPLIKAQALKYAEELNKPDFTASNGWLESFIKRNNIVFKTQSGERADVKNATVTDWKSKLPHLCEGYSPDDIFNMDETGLFFRDTTRKTFTLKGADCAGIFFFF